jgi:hypothetical protein
LALLGRGVVVFMNDSTTVFAGTGESSPGAVISASTGAVVLCDVLFPLLYGYFVVKAG